MPSFEIIPREKGPQLARVPATASLQCAEALILAGVRFSDVGYDPPGWKEAGWTQAGFPPDWTCDESQVDLVTWSSPDGKLKAVLYPVNKASGAWVMALPAELERAELKE